MHIDFVRDRLGDEASLLLGRLLIIFVILLVTWLIRRIVINQMPRLITWLTHRTRTTLDERLLDVIQPPLRFLITVLGLWLVLLVLELPLGITGIVNRVMASLVAVGIFWALYRSVDILMLFLWHVGKRTITTTLGAAPQPGTLLEQKLALALGQVAKAVIIIFAVTTVLERWGYSVGGVVAGLGIGGLAVALAAQDTLANLFGYFIILADEPFVVGEYIVVGDVSGTVEKLGFRSSRIRVLDQSLVTVPNKTMVNSNVTNWSRLAKRRLNMTLELDTKSSPQQVLLVVQAIREMLQAHKLVQADSVVVQFVDFNKNALQIMIICFMKTPNWGDFQAARQDINLRIVSILRKNGVLGTLPPEPAAPAPSAAEVAPLPARPLPPPKPEPTRATATDSPVPPDAANE